MKIKKEKKTLTQGKAMHPFIPLLVMVVLCTIISYFVVPGAYDRETVDGVTRVVADSYHAVERTPVSLFNMFRSIPEGLTATANMMFCIMLIAGMHIFPKLPAGTISVDPGPRYTSAGFMKIKIIGKSGHGAMPESAVDPIYVGAKVVDALQSITSREVNPNDTVVVSICTFHCGTLPNIIAESAELTGTVRTFNPKLQKQLPGIIERIIKGTCEAYRATYEFDYYIDIPATITDDRCSQISQRAVENSIGKEHLIQFPGTPGGEDFSYFLERTPGVYAFVGCRTPENDCVYELHSDKFNLDEDSMLNGAAFYVQYTLEAQREFA